MFKTEIFFKDKTSHSIDCESFEKAKNKALQAHENGCQFFKDGKQFFYSRFEISHAVTSPAPEPKKEGE